MEIRKKWFKIIAPKMLNRAEVGETLSSDAKKIVGKIMEVNVGFLMNDGRRQHMKLKLKIKEINNNQAITEVLGYNTIRAHVRRAVRKDRAKVEDSFIVECKDNIKVRIKPMLVTRYKTKRSILTELKKGMKEYCLDRCKKTGFEELINLVINNRFQRDLKNNLKKTFPVAFSEIKTLEKVF